MTESGPSTATEPNAGIHANNASNKLGTATTASEAANTAVVAAYLERTVPEFTNLSKLRKMGWNNPAGDEVFRKRRERADNADDKMARGFFKLMRGIGRELHGATKAFKLNTPGGRPPRILDMCMAPGGFLAIALEKNPRAQALGFSLPPSQGGHNTLLTQSSNVELRYLDITMLAEDMGVTDIPADHPDADAFLPRQFEDGETFDLVLCDGQVLRTHERAEYRERCEAQRLTATQLSLGLEHLRPGGIMVVLLHRVESWYSVLLLREFSTFATVRLFKPSRSHATRSSFYMVARDIRSKSPQATGAIARWKRIWEVATFEPGDASLEELKAGEPSPEEVIQDFGEELVRLGKNVWEIQAQALEKAPFIRGQNH